MMNKNFRLRSILLRTTCLVCASIWLSPTLGLAQTKTGPDRSCIEYVEYDPTICAHSAAGTTVEMPAPLNTEPVTPADLGSLGFVISVEPQVPVTKTITRPVFTNGMTRASERVAEAEERSVDRLMAINDLRVTNDGLHVHTRLAVSTATTQSVYSGGAQVIFHTSANYASWIDHAEIIIADAEDPKRVIATLPASPNGRSKWTMPHGGPDRMNYRLRVYDAAGRYDETRILPINRAPTEQVISHGKTGPVIAAGEGLDMTARKRIPVTGGAVTVSGQSVAGQPVTVMGESIPVDDSGNFVVQRILPVGEHSVGITANGQEVVRNITVPTSERFYVGMLDFTMERSNTKTETRGRIAGYGKARTASGYVVTAAVDTRETEIRHMFSDVLGKDPLHVLRRLDDQAYPTFGDDSVSFEDAPTSGKVYARVQKENSYLMWGDFKTADVSSRLVGQARTLYGLSGTYESNDQTSHGAAKGRLTGYVAQPDRLLQRDVLRGTGGTFYALKRQDILPDTETLYVETRDRVTGHIIDRRQLVRDVDYTINYYQGTVVLNRPLGGGATSEAILDGPFTDTNTDLVSQYEYTPRTGDVDGVSAGARGEVWLHDNVRIGASAQTETTGIADNQMVGADLLWRYSEKSYVLLDYAYSEGPGFGTSLSLTGGLDFLDEIESPHSQGRTGHGAEAWRVEAKGDLDELTSGALQGDISAYADHKEKGFVGDGYDVARTRKSLGVTARMELGESSELKLSHKQLETVGIGTRRDSSISYSTDITDRLSARIGLAHTRRRAAGTAPDIDNGERTDAAVRLAYQWNDDASMWVYGQKTLSASGQSLDNDRYGLGAKTRLTDRLSLSGEVSDGDLGRAGSVELSYDDNAGNRYYAGLMRGFGDLMNDPWARVTSASLRDEIVFGSEHKLGDSMRVYTERKLGINNLTRDLATNYGVEYTPTDRWKADGLLTLGSVEYPDDPNRDLDRIGLSLGLAYSYEKFDAGWRAEYRRDDDSADLHDRSNWAGSAYTRYAVNESWRLLADLNVMVSNSDLTDLRDGEYIEANLGFAYRPVDNDRWNALLRYTYLHDLPGPDQVNVNGNTYGPKQKSHILGVDVSYDANDRWTLGGKYGYRKAAISARDQNDYIDATSHLAVLRADYHVVHNWDIMAEGRIMWHEEVDAADHAFLVGVYRHFGNNLKVGGGYQWGEVSDNLREIDADNSGMFFNVIGKF